jgi:hypothetical protein
MFDNVCVCAKTLNVILRGVDDAFLRDSAAYVTSTALHEPLPWRTSTLLQGDAADAVAALKQLLLVGRATRSFCRLFAHACVFPSRSTKVEARQVVWLGSSHRKPA